MDTDTDKKKHFVFFRVFFSTNFHFIFFHLAFSTSYGLIEFMFFVVLISYERVILCTIRNVYSFSSVFFLVYFPSVIRLYAALYQLQLGFFESALEELVRSCDKNVLVECLQILSN